MGIPEGFFSKVEEKKKTARKTAGKASVIEEAPKAEPVEAAESEASEPAKAPTVKAEEAGAATSEPATVEPIAEGSTASEPSTPSKRTVGRPKKASTRPNGLQPGEERLTIVAETALAEKMRNYAYTERITLKEAIDMAMRQFLNNEEARGVVILERRK